MRKIVYTSGKPWFTFLHHMAGHYSEVILRCHVAGWTLGWVFVCI